MRHLSRATVFIYAVMLSACAQPNGPDAASAGFSVQPIASEIYTGFEEADRRVIRDAIEWASIWARIYQPSSTKPPLPVVDFSRDQIVVAALGQRPTGGYVIRITGVSGTGNAIKVSVESQSPGSRCGLLTGVTSPVDVVKMTRTVGSVAFEESPIVKNCG